MVVRRVIMSIQHTTRTGRTYYLHVGQGKSGKPNYFFSTAPEGRGLPDRIRFRIACALD
jgi:hypothetical protein